MSEIVEGQFDDADDTCSDIVSKDKDIPLGDKPRLSDGGYEEVDDGDEDYDDEDDYEFDWDGGTGDFTKKYNSFASQKQQVYKTSILIFKDRDKYVSGEFRFRHGYCKHNPRKMVKTWAEKEMRNLIRPAPLLKDVDLSESKARELYLQCIQIIRTLYHQCHLIHADLSEFNLLYHEGGVYVIDVSQSVEHDHPRALEFLRKDCTNITDFFRKKGVSTLTVKELFDFVTDVTITSDNIDQYLDQAMVITSSRTIDDITQQEKIDEEVFKNSFIPRTLDDVIDFERDYIKAQKGDTQEERKKEVKEAQREKRKDKIPKHVKKRKVKTGKKGK
ncbi:hypothetical protein KUTeg_015843 [Tegillarca granosa]|uniref:non-specific serine/threonine protein kinase n=1 Tax=Tegillarca granosa TaxID=220873 RepID=A0ABQ9EJ51_TEGGR|nr:hypothetical protein KUTeg_015843 [Tegillarca granosa]